MKKIDYILLPSMIDIIHKVAFLSINKYELMSHYTLYVWCSYAGGRVIENFQAEWLTVQI